MHVPSWSGDGEDPAPHVGVSPTSGSSLHFSLIQMSWPDQSFSSLHGPLQSESAFTRSGEVVVKRIARYINIRLVIFKWYYRFCPG